MQNHLSSALSEISKRFELRDKGTYTAAHQFRANNSKTSTQQQLQKEQQANNHVACIFHFPYSFSTYFLTLLCRLCNFISQNSIYTPALCSNLYKKGKEYGGGARVSSWSCASSAGSLQRLSSDLAVINVASWQLQLQLQLQFHLWLHVWSCKSEKCLLFMRRYDKKKENTEKDLKQGMQDYETR